MLLNQKHVSTLQSYGAIINGILPNLIEKKKTTNPNKTKIKYELAMQGTTHAVSDEI